MKMIFIPDTFSLMGRRRGVRLRVEAALLILLALVAAACTAGREERATVVAAAYPLAFIAEEIAGNDIEVISLTPAGGEPHDLELTPGQVRSIAESELVLYVGAGFQPAVEDAVAQTDHGLDVLDLVTKISADGRTSDPHAWLDPTQAARIADGVLEQLAKIAPEHRGGFEERHAELTRALDELDSEFAGALGRCERRTIVVSHEAFGYLTERYGLDQVGISGIDPEQEPSPQRLAEVAAFVDDEEIETIFLEKAVSLEVGATLATETGAQVAYLDPLEIRPDDGDLLGVMRANLDSLRRGLECDPLE